MYKFSILQSILQSFQGDEKLKPSIIAERNAISRPTANKYLQELVKQKKLIKKGTAPHVYYRLTQIERNKVVHWLQIDTHNFSYTQTQLLDQTFTKYDATGQLLEGTEGFITWCAQRNIDPYKKYDDYQKIYNNLQKIYNKCGVLDATQEFTKHVHTQWLDHIYYADQYRWMEFGRGKLAEIIFYAKQAQQLDLVYQGIDLFIRKLECLIRNSKVDAIGFIPPSIKRQYQILDIIDKKIDHIAIPRINIVKYYPHKIPIPQKSLKTRQERQRNAEKTIFINDPSATKYKHVLLIDDFVGSGSTLNETALKLKQLGVQKVDGFAIVGNIDLSYEIINEV
jgi:predicted amidophosphoribosyltransferase/predicted transcriptional regulator